MPPDIVIVVPVLSRPHRAQPLADSAARAATVPHRLLFVCTEGDTAQIAACRATGADVQVLPGERRDGDFARKINYGFRFTTDPFIFQAADDVEFARGWDAEALRVIEETETGVCGTNDLANNKVMAGNHSTHSLIRRGYIDECGGALEGPGVVFSETYSHCFVDNELVNLAISRDCFSFAQDAHVAHRHPIWRTAVDDDTYRLGNARFNEDQRLYRQRARQWGEGVSVRNHG